MAKNLQPEVELQIAKLEFADGDILVARATNDYPVDAMRSFANMLKHCVPNGCRVMVLPHDVELSILTKAEIDARVSDPAVKPEEPPAADG